MTSDPSTTSPTPSSDNPPDPPNHPTSSPTSNRPDAHLRFLAASCNRHPRSLATLPHLHLAAYLSHTNLILLSTLTHTVIDTLPLSTSPLNALHILPPTKCNQAPHLFIACSDGAVATATIASSPSSPPSLTALATHNLHQSSCLALHAVELPHPPQSSHPILLASVCDATLITTLLPPAANRHDPPLPHASLPLPQTAHAPTLLVHDIAIHPLPPSKTPTTLAPNTSALIALAGTDRNIHLFHATLHPQNSPAATTSEKPPRHSTPNPPPLVKLLRVAAHRDWIRSLAFAPPPSPSATTAFPAPLLATASADGTARIFKVCGVPGVDVEGGGEVGVGVGGDGVPHPRHLQFEIDGVSCAVRQIALLDEHTGPVHAVTFASPSPLTATESQKGVEKDSCDSKDACDSTSASPFVASRHYHSLLTTSLDGTVAVWRLNAYSNFNVANANDADGDAPVVVCRARFGLMGGHSVHASGFFAADFASCGGTSTTGDGVVVLAAGFYGALHRWEQRQLPMQREGLQDGSVQTNGGTERFDAEEVSSSFVARRGVGGHFAPVGQVVWTPDGRFLASAGEDKTVRLYGEVESGGEKGCFVEWARPQVHGHAVFGVAFCHGDGSRFVSAGEERMLRVFDAPAGFWRFGGSGAGVRDGEVAAGAQLPELGLSNRALFGDGSGGLGGVNGDTGGEGVDRDGGGSGGDMSVVAVGSERGGDVVPLEEELKQATLWPEVAKLYGHGNELACVAVDASSGTIVSACRALSEGEGVMIVWDGERGKEVGRILGHELTVTDVRFSEEGGMLLSVGRDRCLMVCEREGDVEGGSSEFRVVGKVLGAHARVINACAWVGEDFVASGGRDKWVKLFAVGKMEVVGEGGVRKGKGKGKTEPVVSKRFEAGVSALDCAEVEGVRGHVLVVGLDNGDVVVVTVEQVENGDLTLREVWRAGGRMRCGGRVSSVRWRPRRAVDTVGMREVAIASEDMSVRVLVVHFNVNETPA